MRSIHRRFSVIAGFAILLLLLAGNTAVLRHQLAVQVGNQEWFSYSRRVLQELKNIELLLKDAEASQRGFLYTRKLTYLAPYIAASPQVETHLQNLRTLIGNNPEKQAETEELAVLIQQKMEEMGKTISLAQSGDIDGARALVMSDFGGATMDKIRILLGRMEREELSVGNARRATYQQSIHITVACIYLASSVAGIGLTLLAFAIFHELKRRERDAASLRRSEEWFRVTLSSIGDGVIATDEQGRVAFSNSVAEQLTGKTQAQMKGRKISEVFPIFNETTNSPLTNPVDHLLASGSVVNSTSHAVLKQSHGSLVPIEDTVAPITDDSGGLVGAVLVFHDASRERSVQDVLRRTEKLAAAARLAATVSHEINNPLEAVGNLIFLARSQNDATPEIREHLHLAEQELARVAHITKQTLGFYRESMFPSPVDVPALVRSALKLYTNKLEQKQIRLQVNLEDCPSMMGLAGEIQQLIANIISNAIDALPFQGTLRVDASFLPAAGKEFIRLTVTDNGPGIAPENLKRIFEPFFTTKKDVGTGLGLWVCKEIAERHGGSVQVASVNGNGATGAAFTVLLPHQQFSEIAPQAADFLIANATG